ncbi:ABC transporter substrate-binding protein [Tepidimicrobium xylanilyticum]|uniref:Amino acid/amide ABC transporter substrate-binding protein, HAAT family (TC 3.A.1.4.-) n=1 Tax=Tepidimicrobium xylanilyticum TaxID=1123352 RepID=A0A1H2TCH6_9FIRM|nr:ABC transporter substrate-binding protein [Tepidimicrobium xylanilyticum]SDW40974.1 amino acid/amide ABC transporter substrate-binding protein, HAAT family (TC 3.A.1.4.-) [Tepidimicrobium xylanilyticum]
MIKKLSLATLTLLVLILIVGCSASNSNISESDKIRIGLNYELTGNTATYGTNLKDGVLLAFEEINAAGGVLGKELETVVIDNKSDATESANVSTRLATRENVVALLGPATSGNTKAAIPAAMQNKIPLISASATADDVTLDANGNVKEYAFKTCFNNSFQGVMMAQFAYNDLGLRKAAVLADTTSDYAQGLSKSFQKTFKELGGEILSVEAYAAGDTDFKAVLTNLKGENPELLYVPGYYEEVGLIIRQARELGLNVPILGGDGYESPKLFELAGKDALNDIYYSSHYSPMDDSEQVLKFKENFRKKFNKEPDAFNALGYDLGYLVADALERAGEANPEKLKVALEETDGFAGITGTLTIDESHNPIKSVTIIKIVDGEPTFLMKLDPEQ